MQTLQDNVRVKSSETFSLRFILSGCYCGGVQGGRERYEGAEAPDDQEGEDDDSPGGFGPQRPHDGSPPLQSDGQHREDTGGHRGQRYELVQTAVYCPEIPNSAIKCVICTCTYVREEFKC